MYKLTPSRDGARYFSRRPKALALAKAVRAAEGCTASDLQRTGVAKDPANALRSLRKLRDAGIVDEVHERRGEQTVSRWTIRRAWRTWLDETSAARPAEPGRIAEGDRLLVVSGGDADALLPTLSDLGLADELTWVAPVTGSLHAFLTFTGPSAARAVRTTRIRLRREGFDVADGVVDERIGRDELLGWVAGVADERPSHVLDDLDAALADGDHQ
jgi:hypothetical protein